MPAPPTPVRPGLVRVAADLWWAIEHQEGVIVVDTIRVPSLLTEGDARVCAKRALHLLRSRLRPRRRICRTRRLARRRLAEQPPDRPRQLPDFPGALDDHHIGAGGLFGQTQRLHKSRE